MSEIGKLNPLKAGPLTERTSKVTEDKLREVAELYENQFIREMMKQMRATVQESGFLKKNNAEKIFQEQLDGEYSGQWVKAGGIGLSDLIYGQLMERYGERLGLKAAVEKPHGPINLNQKANFSGLTEVGGRPGAGTAAGAGGGVGAETDGAAARGPVTFRLDSPDGERMELKNPWAGVLLDKNYLDMDQMQYRIKHDNGLESLILTRGTGLGPEQNWAAGDRIEAGQSLGWTASASPLFWTLKPDVSE